MLLHKTSKAPLYDLSYLKLPAVFSLGPWKYVAALLIYDFTRVKCNKVFLIKSQLKNV